MFFKFIVLTGVSIILCLAASVSSAEIHDIARRGDLDSLKATLQTHPDQVDAPDDRNCTPLHFACDGGHEELVEYLLGHGAEIEIADSDGDTPLMWAAYAGHMRVVELLIANGANRAVINNNGRTLLHYAARSGSVELVTLLVEKGADINAVDHGGQTPVFEPAMNNNQELVKLLVQKGADLEASDNYGRTPLLLVARERGYADMSMLLLDLGADINAVDRFGATPLNLAAWRGFQTLVDLLLERGANLPDSDDEIRTLVTFAVENKLVSLFSALTERGADFSVSNTKGGTLLHSACEGGSPEITRALLDLEMNINGRDRYGWTPLHYAAKKGRLEVAELIVGRGCDLNLKTLAGYTPVNLAIEFDQPNLVQMLKDKGADAAPLSFVPLQGPYLGQTPPEDNPELFASDIVSSERFEHGTVAFSPDGCEAFWSSSFKLSDSGYSYGRLMTSRLKDGVWTAPLMASFSGIQLGDDIPQFSSDGERLYFVSGRQRPDGSNPGESIWYVDRDDKGWSEPQIVVGGPNLLSHHWQFSVAENGNIYFSSEQHDGFGAGDIYVSKFNDGGYSDPVNLGATVNSQHSEASPFVAPDESYLIVTRVRHPDGLGDLDLAVSYKDTTGNWMTPVNLPAPINTAAREMCPVVSADGKYLFFNSFRNGDADNYWVSARIIEQLRPK